jgi:hypothetical protein
MEVSDVPPALRERLGTEATVSLLELFDTARQEWEPEVTTAAIERFERRLGEEVGAVRTEMADLRTEMGELRTTIRAEMSVFRSEVREESNAFRSEVREEMSTFRSEVREELAKARLDFANLRLDDAAAV